MKRLKFYILFFTSFLLMQSCLHEENDIFDNSAAQRLNEAQRKYSDLLTSATNGWVLEYIAGDTDATRRGAFNYLLSFKNGEVTASVDILALEDIDPTLDPFTKLTSLYKLEQDLSVTLSFDTYNSFLHYYHEQHGSYNTYKGDYEFTFIEASSDLIILRGKKYGNIMRMTPLPADLSWDKYLKEVNATYLHSDEYPLMSLMNGNEKIGRGSKNQNKKFLLTFKGSGDSINIGENVLYTPTGIKFINPIDINGKKVTNLEWNNTNATFTCTDAGSTDISIIMSLPQGYIKYKDFLGTYTLNYKNRYGTEQSRKVIIKPKLERIAYNVENFIINMTDIDIEMRYDKKRGAITLSSQFLKNNPSTGYPISLYPMVESGSFYASTGAAYGRFISKHNNSITDPQIEFTRDPSGNLSAITVGFTTVEKRPNGYYGWNNTYATFKNISLVPNNE